ncbi:NAD(P)/FAD-dependent oxidoreductase [Mycobacterium sp. NPDC003449]
MRRIVIVGASVAGLRAAEAIRAAGWAGHLVVVGREPQLPYSRPQVSKQLLLGKRSVAQARLPLGALDAEWMLGVEATDCDLDAGAVSLSDGRELVFDGLVVASGARPRVLSLPGAELDGVGYLRSSLDAEWLRSALRPGARLVVIGAGFIGGEVASAARKLGCEVVLVDPASAPLAALLGAEAAAELAALHRHNGVDLRMGRNVVAVRGVNRVDGVELDDGSAVPADAVLIAIGSVPNSEWLHSTGLDITDGLRCDAHCFAVGCDDRVVAAGDVARWPVPGLADGLATRVEHWAVAGDQGGAAGSALVMGRQLSAPFRPLLSVTSRQHGATLAILGRPSGAEQVATIVDDGGDKPRFVARYTDGAGRLVGAATLNANASLAGLRAALADADVAGAA